MIVPSSQTLDRSVRGFVAAGSGLGTHAVVPANDKGPAPKGLYATVLEVSNTREGRSWNVQGALNAAETGLPLGTFESVRIDFSLQWLRDGARDAAKLFRLWAGSDLGILEAARRGLTLYTLGELRRLDVPGLTDSLEERVQLDMGIGIVQTATHDVGVFESACSNWDVAVCVDGETPAERIVEPGP